MILLHTDEQMLGDELEPIYNRCILITGCSLEDQLEAMDGTDEWREVVR